MLMSLLSSEAVVDSRDFQILSAEEVDELKRVRLLYFNLGFLLLMFL